VIYLDTRKPGGFEIEDVEALETISGPAARLIYRSFKKRPSIRQFPSFQQ